MSILNSIEDAVQDVTRRAEEAVMALGEPGVLAQAALAVAAVLVGALAGRWLEARLEGAVRGIHGRPMLLRILAVLLRYRKEAGIGNLIAMMLPYSLVFGVVWTLFLLGWVWLGIPLGPGAPLWYTPTGH